MKDFQSQRFVYSEVPQVNLVNIMWWVNKGLMRRTYDHQFSCQHLLPPPYETSPDDVVLLHVCIHLSFYNFLNICISISFILFGWHPISVASTPFTQPPWPSDLQNSPARALPTSQPAAICLFIRLRARLIWPLSRTVMILHHLRSLLIRPMRWA